MREVNDTILCARADDLVTYLYGEATQIEAQSFESHMRSCDSCRTELASFREASEYIGEWRRQALGASPSPATEVNRIRPLVYAQKRSAIAALREFFTLSPAWLRAATAAIALVFCALAVIAVAYFVRQPQTVIVENPVKSGYSPEEVDEMIAKAIREQNESRVKESPLPVPESNAPASSGRPSIPRDSFATVQLAGNKRKRQSNPRPRVARPVIQTSADYLPFTASIDEEKLPSLSDIVEDAN
jgi:hypothetical protein